MQKNLGYVIPSIVIPDATTNIGYWYLGSVPLGVRATGTMWTIGSDHYWYCDNVKTNYLAEIPVEEYNREFQAMLDGYADDWTTWLTGVQGDWNTFYNTSGAEFTAWFNRMKGQLTTDAAGNLQTEIDNIVYSFSENIEDYDVSSKNYAVGDNLVYKNRFCDVIAAITAGDTFIVDSTNPNQNIQYTNVVAKLNNAVYRLSGQIVDPSQVSHDTITVNSIGYDATNNKLILKTGGADTVVPFSGETEHTETYSPTSRNAALDMGLKHEYRYVNTNGVPNANSATYTFPQNDTGGTKDLGETNNYRYANAANVYTKGVTDGRVGYMVIPTATKSITANGNNQDVLNYAKVNVNVPGGTVTKIQRGTFTFTNSVVSIGLSGFTDTNKMTVRLFGNGVSNQTEWRTTSMPYVYSLSTSQLQVYRSYQETTWENGTCSYEVMQHSGITKVQRGTFTIPRTGTTTIGLSGFSDTSKMRVTLYGCGRNNQVDWASGALPYVSSLSTSSLVVAVSCQSGNGMDTTGSYEVVQYV